MTDHSELADRLATSVSGHKALPRFPADLSMTEGQAIQDQLVARMCPGGSAGLKAGVTSAALQKFFKLDNAVLGQLYPTGRLEPGAAIPHLEKLAIECEIGIVVDGDGQPKSVAPAIEFVHLDFAAPEDMTAANLAASNLAADRFMPGAPLPWRDLYDDIIIRLSRDGALVNEASIMESLGGPGNALPWMLAEAKRRGIAVKEGMLLMTGTCGVVVPSQPGHYVADYGELGAINFTIA